MKSLLMILMATACCAVGCDRSERSRTSAVASLRDPVCGMMVDKSTAPKSSTWEGTPYYFCSKECFDKFEKSPSTYLDIPNND